MGSFRKYVDAKAKEYLERDYHRSDEYETAVLSLEGSRQYAEFVRDVTIAVANDERAPLGGPIRLRPRQPSEDWSALRLSGASLDAPGLPDLDWNPFQLGWERLAQRRGQLFHQHQDTGLAGALSLSCADDACKRHQPRRVTLEDRIESR